MNKSIVKDAQQIIELSRLPKEWTWSGLGDLGIVRLGKTPRKADYRDHGDYKIVKFRDVDATGKIDWDKNEKGYVSSSPEILGTLQDLKEGDVLVTASAHMSEHIGKKVGIVLSVPRKYKNAFVVGELLRIRTNNGVDPRWVFYYLGSAEGYKAIQRRVHGVHLIGSRAQHIEVPVAPPDQQVLILGEIEKQFSRLDKAAANLKRVKANLKRYKAAVLKAAVEGQLTEDWRKQHPDVEPATKLLERILAERREKWEGKGQHKEPFGVDINELPAVANGWTWTSVDTLTITGPQNGLYLPQSLYGAGIPILRIDDFQDGWSRAADELQKVRASQAQVRTYCLDEGDFVINRVNSPTHLGKALVVRRKHLPALFESNMMRLRLSSHVQTHFVAFYLQSVDGRRRLTKNAKWAVNQASINQTDVGMTELPLPPFDEQQCIVNEVERRLSVIKELEAAVQANLTRADRLRQSVLGSAFSGKLVRSTV